MSVGQIARKDLADAGRSLSLWAVVGAVVLFTGGTVMLFGFSGDADTRQIVTLTTQLAATIFPVVALFAAKGAITAERESGSLRTLLALPPSRRDVVLGKYAGRVGLVTVATVAGVVATVAALVATGNTPGVTIIGTFGATVLGLTVSFVALGVGVSAAVATDGRASGVAVGLYVLFVVLWGPLTRGVLLGAREFGLVASGVTPWWIHVFGTLAPNEAATGLFAAVVSGSLFAADPTQSVWLPVAVLLAWTVVPVAVGYWRFRSADLG